MATIKERKIPTQKQAVSAAKCIVEYCKSQPNCDNCFFKQVGCGDKYFTIGLVFNEGGDLAIPHERKKTLKAKIFTFMTDYQNGSPWDVNRVQTLADEITYYERIDAVFVKETLKKYSDKFGINIAKTINDIVNNIAC